MANKSSMHEVQHQIRANASELQDYFTDLYSWEKSIEKVDQEKRRETHSTRTSLPRVRQTAAPPQSGNGVATTKPDAHTYDKGYKKWEKFDVVRTLSSARI